MSLTPIEIQDLAAYRYQSFAPLRANWDTMAGIFNNQHRNLFPDEYPADRIPLIAGFAKRSWQMYVRLCSKNPSLYVSPLKETKGARDSQERIEKILYGYNDIWDLERRLDVFYTYRIGMGAAGVGVIPDPTNKFPKLLTEDPRNCVDEETEILTKRGWLRHDALTTEDEIAGYDLDTGLARWTRCHSIHCYQHDGAMIAIDRRTLSMRLTPDHRCVVQKRVGLHENRPDGQTRVVTARHLSGWHFIPRSADWIDYGEKSIGANLAAICGWVATEGWYHGNAVWLCQSESANPAKVATIDALLPAEGLYRKARCRIGRDGRLDDTLVEWRLPFDLAWEIQRLMPSKRLGSWCLDLPEEERRALLFAFIAGDGSKQAKGTGYIVYQKERENLDVLQAVAVTLGFKTHVAFCGHLWTLYLSRGGPASLRRRVNRECEPVIPTEHHEGLVWCPTTGTGTWFARRNGSVFITGNCLPAPNWSAASATAPGFLGMSLNQWIAGQDAGAGTLDNMIVRKSMTGRQIRSLAAAGGYMSEALAKAIPDDTLSQERPYSVLQYYDSTDCVSVLNGYAIPLWAAPHGAPWCPWWFPCSFAPDIAAGDTDYIGQVGLEVAFGTLLNQKLALNDAVIWPWMVQSGQFETYPERRLMVASSPDAKANILSPPPQFQVDKDMSMLRDLMRLLNLETEATQGTMPGGPITGQGISNMNQASVVEKVQAYFRETGWWLSRLYATALIEDRNVFPDAEKHLAGWAKGEEFFTSYTPGTDIGPKLGRIRTDFGPGLGGYQGHVAMLQDLGAESISMTTVMEHNENIRSVSNEKRRLFLEALNKMFMAGMAGQAAVPMDWIARCYSAVGDGADPMEWVTANPPGQNQATPGNVPPVPPEIAAAAAAQGAGQAGGAPGAGLGQAAPPETAFPGGLGPGPNMWHPPPMRNLVGR